MERTSIEDFQDYHNHHPASDVDDILSLPPSFDPLYSRNRDHALPQTVEPDHTDDDASPNEAIFDPPSHSRSSSPPTSHSSDDDISVISSYTLPSHQPPPFTPLKTRSAFRTPSSVRAMQTATTPPQLTPSSHHRQQQSFTPSRRSTPCSARRTPTTLSPTKKLKKEYPLILLHITLLPIPQQYPSQILEQVLPPSTLANWTLLLEKATRTVLSRGILIPHPREDYDLLEERLLESLELKQARILKCGHFHLSPEEEADILAAGDDAEDEEVEDGDICVDCGRRIGDGMSGTSGTGNKRWDIKLFAANGLMRAGAWSAAWREMERVDVEILPFMTEDLKRELEFRKEEEERAAEDKFATERGQDEREREEGVGGLDDERLREIYGQDAQAFVDGLADEKTPAAVPPTQSTPQQQQSPRSQHPKHDDIPLSDLLRNYIYLAAQDRRNIAIFLLSTIVLFLTLTSFPAMAPPSPLPASQQTYIISTPFPPITEATTDAMSIASSPVPSAASPTLSTSSEPLQEHQPQEEKPGAEEPEEQSSVEEENPWIEAAEDMVREILED